MSWAIVGRHRAVRPKFANAERILVLRILLPGNRAERKSVSRWRCKPVNAARPLKARGRFYRHGILRPDRHCTRRAAVLADRERESVYADLELDSGSLDVIALDGVPFLPQPVDHTRSMSHVVPPAGSISNCNGPTADSHAAALTLFDTVQMRFQSGNGAGYRLGTGPNVQTRHLADHRFTQPFTQYTQTR